jgi:hypothetical protein
MWLIEAAPPYLFSAGAIVCFALTILFAFRINGFKSATLFGTLFFICSVLAYFPKLDSVAAFSVNVKLHNNLDRAEEVIKKLKDITVANAKASYMQFTGAAVLADLMPVTRRRYLIM